METIKINGRLFKGRYAQAVIKLEEGEFISFSDVTNGFEQENTTGFEQLIRRLKDAEYPVKIYSKNSIRSTRVCKETEETRKNDNALNFEELEKEIMKIETGMEDFKKKVQELLNKKDFKHLGKAKIEDVKYEYAFNFIITFSETSDLFIHIYFRDGNVLKINEFPSYYYYA